MTDFEPRRSRPAAGVLVVSAALAVLAAAGARPAAGAAQPGARGPRFPNVLVISIDTLRTDRMSAYGYQRPTSPEIARLLARGTKFAEARTVEPLTGPSSCSLLTSRFPHEHGATRNGLKLRPRLASLPKLLEQRGYKTAAFVGNWTLRDALTGLAEHFDEYHEVFTRNRWFGMFNEEATGEDLTAEAVAWIEQHRKEERSPYLAWVHYVEPHAPYRFWEEFAKQLGIRFQKGVPKSDRYDTEVAYTDREVGRLLRALGGAEELPDDTLVVFLSDHGESLGEHGYWGHGRHLYENSLRIPMGLVWPGRVPAGTIAEPALIIDLAPTVLGLLGLPGPDEFRGFDWAPVFRGEGKASDRPGYFQAHKGAVQFDHTSSAARADGLLEVSRVTGTRKEILDVGSGAVRIYDFARDPGEVRNLAPSGAKPSPDLVTWLEAVRAGLRAASDIPPATLDAESRDRLRALGYVD
ncbi:MAG TPA: sulfatase [Thermoanaerobaculia bacterium]|nr:sulfatase [Thermoanaerobaculia bacterium]